MINFGTQFNKNQINSQCFKITFSIRLFKNNRQNQRLKNIDATKFDNDQTKNQKLMMIFND